MSSLITEHWNRDERELPGQDCIAYPDGTVVVLHHYTIYDPNTDKREYYCKPLCDTTIDSIEKYNTIDWVRVDEWTNIDYNGGKIYGGDGTMGNEGFIACTDENDFLIWGIFFENTNPIKSLSLKENTLIAINEHSEIKIEIDLNNITDIKMCSLLKD